MKELDHDGLLLAEYQGKLFEKSADLNCSTAVFIRRFLHSEFVKKLDKNDLSALSLDVKEGMDSIQSQFGDSDYGMGKQSIPKVHCFGSVICIDTFHIPEKLRQSL